jgi:hypothetical protein
LTRSRSLIRRTSIGNDTTMEVDNTNNDTDDYMELQDTTNQQERIKNNNKESY